MYPCEHCELPRDGTSRFNNSGTVGHDCIGTLQDRIEQLKTTLLGCSGLARGAEPENGWGSRSTINDAWADGFRTAAVEISDAIRKTIEAKGEQK